VNVRGEIKRHRKFKEYRRDGHSLKSNGVYLPKIRIRYENQNVSARNMFFDLNYT
jgi:hypothetical protein